MTLTTKLIFTSALASAPLLLASMTTAVAQTDDAVPEAIAAIIAFDAAAEPLDAPLRIAYLSECAQNAYCQARLRGIEAAAETYGFEFQLFDANFNPAEQLKQVQNATAAGFDGYIFAPTAGAPSCNMYRQFLEGTGKPVVSINLPMCGDENYTEGLAATVTMQGQSYFDTHVQNAFAACEGECQAAAVGGFLGSDLFALWDAAVQKADEMYPNVEVVVNQPGNFDPRTALRVIQDGLNANPDISIVVSSWDDMTRGVEQAVTSVGKVPGEDVHIYSVGANEDGLSRVVSGAYSGTTMLLPFDESYYGAVALVMALKGEPLNAHIDQSMLPAVTEGPGTILITQDNAASVTPAY